MNEEAFLNNKIKISKEFNREILDLINKLQAKYPADVEIERVKSLILLAISTDELILVIEAGSLMFKYRGLLDKIKAGADVKKLAENIEELKSAKESTYGELVAHILSTSLNAFSSSTKEEKAELYTKISVLIVTYAKFLKLEKTGKV